MLHGGNGPCARALQAIQRWRASRLREQQARIQGQGQGEGEGEESGRTEEAKNQAQQHR